MLHYNYKKIFFFLIRKSKEIFDFQALEVPFPEV